MDKDLKPNDSKRYVPSIELVRFYKYANSHKMFQTVAWIMTFNLLKI
jgi:hypothetical protein